MTERLQIEPGALIRARTKLGLTQAEVAVAAGVSRQLIGDLEKGKRAATGAVARAIAAALEVSPAEIVINYRPPETGRHRAAVERALAAAPPIDAEQARAIRSLLAGYAAAVRDEQVIADSRQETA